MTKTISPDTQSLLLPATPMRATIPDTYEISVADLFRPYTTEGTEAEVALLGIPFDTTTIVRRGARFGPQAIRAALAGSTSFEPGLGIDLADGPTICDVGDVDTIQTSIQLTWERTQTVVSDLVQAGFSLLVMGGDHGNVYPVVCGVAEALQRPVGIIVFDSHFDVRISHHDEVSSGVPFRYLLEHNPVVVRGENLVEIGLVGWHNARLYRDYCLERGVTLISAREVHRTPVEEIVQRALSAAGHGTDAIWVSVDVDCLDAAFAPGTNAPSVGGLTSAQLLEIVYLLGQDSRVVGMDVMEVSPPFDVGGTTAALAAALMLTYLAGRQQRRRR
jgi:formimidoylglutamase